VFGHKADPSRIFTYKCKVPHDGLDVAEEQLRLARRYKNRLIELELGRRAAVDEAMRRHAPRVAEAERRIAGLTPRVEEAERAVKLRKQDKHRRVADGAPTRAEATAALKALRAELKAARADRRRYRAEEFEGNAGLAADLTVLEADHAAALREARRVASKEWGLYWATYLVREQAARANRKGAPPVFRRWDGTGAIAVQLQNGLAVPDLLAGGDSRLRLGLAAVGRGPRGPIPADPTSNRSRSKRWATVAFRAGTGPDGRSPIWVRATVRVHRPPPAGAAVKWAYLRRVVAGVHARWELQLVLADPAGWDPGDQADAGAASPTWPATTAAGRTWSCPTGWSPPGRRPTPSGRSGTASSTRPAPPSPPGWPAGRCPTGWPRPRPGSGPGSRRGGWPRWPAGGRRAGSRGTTTPTPPWRPGGPGSGTWTPTRPGSAPAPSGCGTTSIASSPPGCGGPIARSGSRRSTGANSSGGRPPRAATRRWGGTCSGWRPWADWSSSSAGRSPSWSGSPPP
jgi:hypothetical protein